MRASLGYLEKNLELDVGGNHLIKELKDIIGLALFFGETERAERVLDRLEPQVLSDGGHYEMSPSCRAQVMADLLNISALCREAFGKPVRFIDGRTKDTADWLGAMSYPNGALPLIGDCRPPTPGLLETLRALLHPCGPSELEVLEDTGYVGIRPRPDVIAVFDFGPPCPPELAGHAQADWGTFELLIGGERMILDPGICTHVGDRRQWERSTAAHNTVRIEGQYQTEVWGRFRARARLVTHQLERAGSRHGVMASAEDCRGHRLDRMVTFRSHEISIEDRIVKRRGSVSSFLSESPIAETACELRCNAVQVANGMAGSQEVHQVTIGLAAGHRLITIVGLRSQRVHIENSES